VEPYPFSIFVFMAYTEQSDLFVYARIFQALTSVLRISPPKFCRYFSPLMLRVRPSHYARVDSSEYYLLRSTIFNLLSYLISTFLLFFFHCLTHILQLPLLENLASIYQLTLWRLTTYVMSYRTANLQTLHFKYLLNKYTY
jgi:hypothetical protein